MSQAIRTRYSLRGCSVTDDSSGCPGAQPDSARFDEIDISGDQATVVIAIEGGVLDGQAPEIDLVVEDGVWKVDSISSDVPAGP